MISRRAFVFKSVAFATLAGLGRRALAAARGPRRLRLGVVSDIHISLGNLTPKAREEASVAFRKALKWFDAEGVDAVAIPGDLADTGSVIDLKEVGAAWDAVFPDGKGADGRRVDHLLITGNHDTYRKFRKNEPSVYDDIKATWREVFREDYDEVRVKTVKGIDFVLAGWYSRDAAYQAAAQKVAKRAAGKPFFFLRHMHPKGTCHGPFAWGHDGGGVTNALKAYPNAVALSGHSHYVLTDERTVWQERYTSIGCGSLKYSEGQTEDFPPLGAENADIPYRGVDVPFAEGAKDAVNDAKFMRPYEGCRVADGKQGMLIDVYDDGLVIRRHEFVFDEDLGETWEVPLPAKRGGAFDPSVRKDATPLCEFAAGAALARRDGTGKTRDGVAHDAIVLTVPGGAATTGAPLIGYDVGYLKGTKFRHLQFVVANDFCLPPAKKIAAMEIPVRRDRVPEGVKLAVKPLNCYVRPGAALVCA